jgi:hypothetical protein
MAYYKLVNGKRYGPYNYSPRNKHDWTAKDLARIAKYLHDKRGVDAKEIIVLIAGAVGMGLIFCKAAKAISSGLSIMAFIEKIAVILAFSQAVTVLLEYLLAVKLVAPSWLKIILALFIAMLIFIEKMLKQFNEFAQNREVVIESAKTIGDLCDTAKRLSGQVVDKTCEQINADACYWAEKKADEIANGLKPEIDKAIAELDKSLMERFWEMVQDNLHDGEWSNWTN